VIERTGFVAVGVVVGPVVLGGPMGGG
jgi:hypothetical protein